MKREIAVRWTAALRSGEYGQCTSMLQDGEGFCCLGVLCDIYAKEHPSKGRWQDGCFVTAEDGEDPERTDDTELPLAVKEWAGMDSFSGIISPGSHTLIELNDDYRKTFAQIADVIDANVEQL